MVTLDRRNVLLFSHSHYPAQPHLSWSRRLKEGSCFGLRLYLTHGVCLCPLKGKWALAAIIHNAEVFLVNPSGVYYVGRASVWAFVLNVVS